MSYRKILVLLLLFAVGICGHTAAADALIAGNLVLCVANTGQGLTLESLYDQGTAQEMLSAHPLPLFELILRDQSGKEMRIDATSNWRKVEVVPQGSELQLTWGNPNDTELSGIEVLVTARAVSENSSIHWDMRIENDSDIWSVWRVFFPQVSLAKLGDKGGSLFYPRESGIVKTNAWGETFSYDEPYPRGVFFNMQYFAAYDPFKTGLYFGMHDPMASMKNMKIEASPYYKTLDFQLSHPAPNMGIPGNEFTLSGEAVWQLLRGDWFDAAMIYKDWVTKNATWYPDLGVDGRQDTPQWMKELPVWVQMNGAVDYVVPALKDFAEFMDVPVGFHWYQWHQIPFDNDYPHYFPTKDGMAEGIQELLAAGIYAMPYVNSRMWDTRDRGAEDFMFSEVALPGVAKDIDGSIYTETTKSKESDGSRVRMGVMCPTTDIWQGTLSDVVLRLFNEYGTKAVYLDQLTGPPPIYCFDPTHDHEPGGGSYWWSEGFWPWLEEIRENMPEEGVLTGENNAELYGRFIDGYLTWTWRSDGLVPAFPAVYGGSIQMFGRSYQGYGQVKYHPAVRAKAGMQLVYGEQIGWWNPKIINQYVIRDYLRDVIRLRYKLSRYFYAGEMARPPQLANAPKTVTDWFWRRQKTENTTDAVMTGAWLQKDQHKLALIFVNTTDSPVKAEISLDLADYGLSGEKFVVTKVTAGANENERFSTGQQLKQEVTFQPETAWAWEVAEEK